MSIAFQYNDMLYRVNVWVMTGGLQLRCDVILRLLTIVIIKTICINFFIIFWQSSVNKIRTSESRYLSSSGANDFSFLFKFPITIEVQSFMELSKKIEDNI